MRLDGSNYYGPNRTTKFEEKGEFKKLVNNYKEKKRKKNKKRKKKLENICTVPDVFSSGHFFDPMVTSAPKFLIPQG